MCFSAINIIQLVLFCIFIPHYLQNINLQQDFFVSENYIGILAAGYVTRGIINYYVSTILFTKNKCTGPYFCECRSDTAWTYVDFVKTIRNKRRYLRRAFNQSAAVVFCMLFTKNVFRIQLQRVKDIDHPVVLFCNQRGAVFHFPTTMFSLPRTAPYFLAAVLFYFPATRSLKPSRRFFHGKCLIWLFPHQSSGKKRCLACLLLVCPNFITWGNGFQRKRRTGSFGKAQFGGIVSKFRITEPAFL